MTESVLAPSRVSFLRRSIAAIAATGMCLSVVACSDSSNSSSTETLDTRTAELSSNTEAAESARTSTNNTAGNSAPQSSPATASSDAGVAPVGIADTATKTQRQSDGAELVVTGVRVGKHDTFDRVVFDLEGTGAPGWFIEYTNSPAQQGSGNPVEYAGDTALNVNIEGTLMPFELGLPDPQLGTIDGTDQVITQVISQGTFEGRAQFVIGVRGPAHPYAVQVLEEPTRLVIDIHRS